MFQYEFTARALKDLKKLPNQIQFSIIRKLDFCISSPNPLFHAKSLTNSSLGEYRMRVGDYRVTFDMEKETMVILRVGHRKEIYR